MRRGVGIALALLPAIAACAPDEPDEFRIGVFALMELPFDSSSGIPTREGAALFVDSVNAAGGLVIGGRTHRVVLANVEHGLAVEDATTAARRLLNLDRVHAFIGPQLSAHAIPVGGIADRAGIPMISPMSSNPATTRDRSFVFRVANLDEVQGRVMARIAVEDLGATVLGVLYDRTSDYSQAVTATFSSAADSLGVRVVVQDFPGRNTTDFRTQLEALQRDGVTALLLPNTPITTEAILRQAAEIGLNATYLGTDGWDVRRIVDLPGANGTLIAHQWTLGLTSAARAFERRYQERWGATPRATAAATFDAVRLLADAAVRAGSLDGVALRDALAASPPVDAVVGTLDLQPDGNARRSIFVSVIDGGDYHLYRQVDPGEVR